MSAHRAPTARRTRTVAIAGATAVALVVAGVAFATWIVSGEGSGPVSSASIQPLSVQLSGVDGLYPGATVDATALVSNPNPYPVVVDSVTPSSDSTCYTVVADPLPPGLSLDGADSTGVSSPRSLHVAVSMPSDAPASCSSGHYTWSLVVRASVGQ